MMLMRFDPFRELDRLTDQLWGTAGRATRAVPMDAYRAGDRFLIRFDLPGFDPSSIDLTVEKNVLTVRAERRWDAGEEAEVLVRERPEGSFTRQLFLGDGLDTGAVDASYEHGVLTLSIPVAEAARPHKVEVKWNGGQSAIETTSMPSNGDRHTQAA